MKGKDETKEKLCKRFAESEAERKQIDKKLRISESKCKGLIEKRVPWYNIYRQPTNPGFVMRC